MKLIQELLEAVTPSGDLQGALTKAIDAALAVNHSKLASLDMDGDSANFQVMYEFPEHRTGIPKEVKNAFKGFGTVSSEKFSERGEYVLSFTANFKDAIEDKVAEKIEKALKTKHKKDLDYFGHFGR